jgi:biopolymer transport protein ExbD
LQRHPKRCAKPPWITTGTSILVTIAANGTVHVDSVLVQGDAAITDAVKKAVAGGQTRATIACDKSRPFGEVIHVVDLCKQAGATQISFAVTPA